MADNDRLHLTRRKLLAGTTAIGAAGLGAGLGTSALFSDEESFEDNTITAGTLDMSVTATVEATNDYWSDGIGASETADGEPVVAFDVSDVKPGDWAIICFDIDVAGNPGYVQVSTANLASTENGYTEPEPEDDTPNGGELDDAILATVWHEYDGSGAREGLSYLDVTTNENRGNQGQIASHSWTPDRNLGGDNGKVNPRIEYATLQEAYATYETGVTLGGSNDPTPVGSTDETPEFCLLLELPEYIGNEVQGDSISFDLVFDAVQARNNDAPFQTERIELGPDAAQNTGFQAQSGDGYLGSGYWTDDPGQTNQDGGDYEQLYVTFDQGFGPYYVDSLARFTLGDIESVRYRTRRPQGATQDYFMEIFTVPDGSNDDASWYGRQLQALPGDALNRSVSANTWLTWQTDAGTNQLTFYDFNHDYDTTDSNSPPYLGQDTGVTLADLQSTPSFDWSTHVAAADATPKNYRDEEVRAFRFATGSAWEDTHEGDLDAIEIELSDGRRAVIDLE